MKTLTAAQLTAAGACHEQVALFRKTFGLQVEVTEALCLQHASAFAFGWAADNLLDDQQRHAYDEARAPALKAYDEATAPARKAYDEACALAYKAYDEARAPADKAYDEATALADKAYHEACALAFCHAYNS